MERTSVVQKALRFKSRDILEVLKQTEEKIPDDKDLQNIIAAAHYMIATNTGSGVERYLPGKSVPGGHTSQLNRSRCDFAMRLFNNLTLKDAQIQVLKPILAPVLQAAFDGYCTVVQYFKDTGLNLVLPGALRGDWSREVYMRDCSCDD